MEPTRLGRTVGIGTRLAARILRERATRAASHVEQNAPRYAERSRQLQGSVREGSRRFGRSVWKPFAHASSVLWLEVTGLFFALFTLFFLTNAFRLRAAWRTGPEHQRFLLYSLCAAVFVYFTVSSFYRAARRKSHPR
jgi:hypothetical protein